MSEAWLFESNYFEEGSVLQIVPLPKRHEPLFVHIEIPGREHNVRLPLVGHAVVVTCKDGNRVTTEIQPVVGTEWGWLPVDEAIYAHVEGTPFKQHPALWLTTGNPQYDGVSWFLHHSGGGATRIQPPPPPPPPPPNRPAPAPNPVVPDA